MNYKRVYDEFIKDRLGRQPIAPIYFERHHITPRCMGGTNEPENLIRLTAGDHFFSHILLAKVHGGKMWYALNALIASSHIGERKLDRAFTVRARRYYENIRIEFAKVHSAKMKGVHTGAAHPMYGKPCSPVALEKLLKRLAAGFNPMNSPEVREKVSKAMKGRIISPEWRKKISAARKGFKASDETRAAISKGHIGIKHSAESRANMSAAQRGKPKSPEGIEKMKKSLTGRKLSPEHVEKLRPHLAKLSRFRGVSHTAETRQRMSAVNKAKRTYVATYGGDARKVNIAMMRSVGIEI